MNYNFLSLSWSIYLLLTLFCFLGGRKTVNPNPDLKLLKSNYRIYLFSAVEAGLWGAFCSFWGPH